jgi:hypothetical protein
MNTIFLFTLLYFAKAHLTDIATALSTILPENVFRIVVFDFGKKEE